MNKKAMLTVPANYGQLLVEVKERVHAAQYAALKTVNKALLGLYWDIGQLVVKKQAGETWGPPKYVRSHL